MIRADAPAPAGTAGNAPAPAPRVSVIVPAFNAEHTLVETLDSVYTQSFRDLETIVVDDGSVDGTARILEDYGHELRVIHKRNEGRPAAARNRGVAAARGEYVAFLDADDRWEPTKLARQVELMDSNPRLGLCYTAALVIDGEGHGVRLQHCRPEARGKIHDLVSVQNVMVGSSVMARRQAVLEAGGFDEELTSIENWDLWIRIARGWEIDFVDEPLTQYRQHAGNRSVDVELRRRNIFRILDRHHPRGDRSPGARRRRRDAYFNAYFAVLGIGYLGRLEMAAARRAFWRALWLKPRPDVLRYLLLAAMGKRLFLATRAARRRLQGRPADQPEDGG